MLALLLFQKVPFFLFVLLFLIFRRFFFFLLLCLTCSVMHFSFDWNEFFSGDFFFSSGFISNASKKCMDHRYITLFFFEQSVDIFTQRNQLFTVRSRERVKISIAIRFFFLSFSFFHFSFSFFAFSSFFFRDRKSVV